MQRVCILYITCICDGKLDFEIKISRAPFLAGYQSTSKMAAISMESKTMIAQELVRLFKRVDYVSTVRPLKEIETLMINEYDKLNIAKWYDLDTTHCFVGKKKPKFNKHCVYDIFVGYCNLSKFELKDKVTKEVSENTVWYDRLGHVYFGWKNTDVSTWLKKQKFKNNAPDEMCIYALSVIFRWHTIIYNTYQPWCTVDIKPGMWPEVVEEACKTRLVYLGDNLFGELKRKLLTMTSWPQVNIDDIQVAQILHRDPNLMEMYIEHAASMDFNTQNTNIFRNVQTFLSPSDITMILPSAPTVFDMDYIPENKVEPDIIDQNTVFTLTESMGSNLGEISFPSTVKDELTETVEQVLSTHSPTCQLCCGIETRLESLASMQRETNEQEPSPTEGYSSEEAIPLSLVTSSNGDSVLSSQEVDANVVFCLQDVSEGSQDISSTAMSIDVDGQAPGEFSDPVIENSSQDITGASVETSQDVTCSQEVTTILSTSTTDIMTQHDPTDVISICPIASNSCDAETMDIDTAIGANADKMNTGSTTASSDRLCEVSNVHNIYGNNHESALCDLLNTSENISQELTLTVIEPMGMNSNSESNMSVLDCAIGTQNVSIMNTSTEALAGDLSGNMIDTSSQEVTRLTMDSGPCDLMANAS